MWNLAKKSGQGTAAMMINLSNKKEKVCVSFLANEIEPNHFYV